MDMYEQFHAYVRYKLSKIYKIPKRQPIPMHLLGNIMGQMWDEVMKRNWKRRDYTFLANCVFVLLFQIEDIIQPHPNISLANIDEEMVKQDYTPLKMFQEAERYFVSMGFPPLPE